MDAPVYSRQPIWSATALCKALAIPEPMLRSIADRAPKLYVGPTPKPKKNGNGFRDVYDTRPPLKALLKRINKVFFERVQFPDYLHGSIRGRDFISNVQMHEDSRVAITEDIRGFFDHITDTHAYDIWRRFFGFGDEPAELLTRLVAKGRRVYQGTPTSSYLANLVFWDIESRIVQDLSGRGLRYSRFVDDITLSHSVGMSGEDKTWAIARIYGMLSAKGFKPARNKQAILSGVGPLTVMRLNVNEYPTITPKERGQVRAMVHQLEIRVHHGENGTEVHHALAVAIGKIGRLQRLHPREAAALRERTGVLRDLLKTQPFTTGPSIGGTAQVVHAAEAPF
jgi:Reverse transcriptase (RNA-dependent DNA polymerase)